MTTAPIKILTAWASTPDDYTARVVHDEGKESMTFMVELPEGMSREDAESLVARVADGESYEFRIGFSHPGFES